MSSWLILIIILVIILIVWWALLRSTKTYKPDFEVHPEEAHPEAEATAAEPAAPAAAAETPPPAAVKVDDLTILEGIGPKINGLLQAAGITSFTQLADTDISRLRTILDAADLRFIDPASWGEQAKLAAEGKTAELQELQGKLKGGRKVD
jgi:predicted flap endonuclease-1-like 5' DNA nuclease